MGYWPCLDKLGTGGGLSCLPRLRGWQGCLSRHYARAPKRAPAREASPRIGHLEAGAKVPRVAYEQWRRFGESGIGEHDQGLSSTKTPPVHGEPVSQKARAVKCSSSLPPTRPRTLLDGTTDPCRVLFHRRGLERSSMARRIQFDSCRIRRHALHPEGEARRTRASTTRPNPRTPGMLPLETDSPMDQNQKPLSPRGEPVDVLGLRLVGGALDTTVRPSRTSKSGQDRHVSARAAYRFLPLLWCLVVGIGCATGGPLEDIVDDSPGSPNRGNDADGGRPRTPTPSSPASSGPAPSSTSTGSERDGQGDASTRDGSLVPDAVAADARPDTSTAIDAGPCAHPPTSTGGPLSVTCSSCVAAVCATNPGCCTSAWDTTCLIQQSLNAACKP